MWKEDWELNRVYGNESEKAEMMNDEERDLEVLLSYLLNKPLKSSEVIVALGISRSAYYDQKDRGCLTSPNNLVAAARYYGLNPLELLVPYGHVASADAIDFALTAIRRRDGAMVLLDGHDGATVDADLDIKPAERKGGPVLGRRGAADEHHFGPPV